MDGLEDTKSLAPDATAAAIARKIDALFAQKGIRTNFPAMVILPGVNAAEIGQIVNTLRGDKRA